MLQDALPRATSTPTMFRRVDTCRTITSVLVSCDDDNGGILLTSFITSGQGICLLKFPCNSFFITHMNLLCTFLYLARILPFRFGVGMHLVGEIANKCA